MDLFESTPEAKFRKRVQSFAKEQVAPVAEKVEEGWFPREVLRKLGEQQLLGVAFSKSDGALGLTEPGAGSDAASIKTHAERRGQDFVLNGEKRFITNGGVADFLFVFAVTEPRKPPKSGVSALVVPREFEGVQVVKTYGLLGMRGANVVHLRFRNVRVPEENIVGGLHRGFPILLDELDRERPAVAAGMLGIARSAFE